MSDTLTLDDPAATAALGDSANPPELPAIEDNPPEFQTSTDTPSVPAEPTGEQEGIASIFADPHDLYRYRAARANGASEEEALKVGDNGIGKWGDVTATYKIPMVALPSDTPGINRGRLVRVTGSDGSVVAKVADVMPDTANLQGKSNIDLNPAAALAVGHKGGVMPVKWEFVSDPGDAKTDPHLAELPHPMSSKQSFGSLGSMVPDMSNAEVKNRNSDGSVTFDNGVTMYPDMSIVVERGGEKFLRLSNGQIQKLGAVKSGTVKTPEELATEAAAKKGLLRSEFPEGPEGDNAYKKARTDTLQASRAGVGTDPVVLADAIIAGEQPPSLSQLYGRSGAVRTELAKKKYPLAEAQLDWQGAQKYIGTLNSGQQLRIRQNLDFATSSLDVIDSLNHEWKGGSFPLLNKARLIAAKNGALGPEAQRIATQLDAQINDFVASVGNIYMGGNSPTDHSLRLSAENMKSDWGENQMEAMIGLSRKNLQIRSNSIKNAGVVGATGGTNTYLPGATGSSATPAGSPSATPTPQPTAVDPQSAISAAQRRLQSNPNDDKAKAVLQRAKDLGLLQ